MNSEQIFAMAIGLGAPWGIKEVSFKGEGLEKELNIYLEFKRGHKFKNKKDELCSVHDTIEKKWRHLNFFQHKCYLHCRVPRLKGEDGSVELAEVPWSRPQSGFTLLFEAYVMALIENEMPINKVGKIISEDAHRVWTIFNHWIVKAKRNHEPNQPTNLGFDETSRRKGHKYITLGVDLDERKVLHIAPGKDKAAIGSIKEYLIEKNLDPGKVKQTCIDLSPSFIPGVMEHFPNAEINFDKFHVVQLLNRAMDEVRKQERKEHAELKGYKYSFLKKNGNLNDKKRKEVSELVTLFPSLGEAYRLKELFFDLWEMETVEEANDFLEEWCKEAEAKKIGPFMTFVKTLKSHKSGIINYVKTKISNGILEGINSKIQLAKRRARGYRKIENFMNMIYFLCGKLTFDYDGNYPLISS